MTTKIAADAQRSFAPADAASQGAAGAAIGPASGSESLMIERAAWSALWLGVLAGGVSTTYFWWDTALGAAVAPLMILLALAGLMATWLTATPELRWLQAAALAGTELAVALPQAIAIETRHYYSTDSAAFDQLGARALLNGHNPYAVSLQSAAHLFSAPAHFWTYTVNGGHVTSASYPAGSFLLQLPAMLMGAHHMVVDWTDLVLWMATVAIIFLLLPSSKRWLAGVLALSTFFISTFSNGNTDAMYLPLLLLALWRWDRYGDPGERGIARWIGPVALGLACAVKQTPWFCVPFLTLGVAIEARYAGRAALAGAARYLATVLAVFAAVNLPFAIWGPHAWLNGVLLPLTGGLVADGQGLVTLALHGVTGGAELQMLSAAGAMALLAALLAFVLWYPALKRIWLLLVPIVFFFPPRSLSTYLLDLVPLALIAAISVRAPGGGHRAPRAAVAAFAALVIGVVAAGVLALSAQTLQIEIDRAQLQKAANQSVTITVRNLTDSTQRAHFMVNPGEGTAGFWRTGSGGPVILAPHAHRRLTLHPPAEVSPPQKGARWLVEAYTSEPDVLSTSSLQPWPFS